MGFENDVAIQEDTWYSLGQCDLGLGDGSGDRSGDGSGDRSGDRSGDSGKEGDGWKVKIGVQDHNKWPAE